MSDYLPNAGQPYPNEGKHRGLDSTQNDMVSSRGPVESKPHAGHEGTTYEEVDAKAGVVLTSLAVIGGTLIFVYALTLAIHSLLIKANPQGSLPSPIAPERVLPPEPRLEVHPWDILPDLRAHEDQVLGSYGKDAEGHVHIPIDRAVSAVVSRLNISPGAPQGINTPGGEGRTFGGRLSDLPATYQRPQIQGEIRKNAK